MEKLESSAPVCAWYLLHSTAADTSWVTEMLINTTSIPGKMMRLIFFFLILFVYFILKHNLHFCFLNYIHSGITHFIGLFFLWARISEGFKMWQFLDKCRFQPVVGAAHCCLFCCPLPAHSWMRQERPFCLHRLSEMHPKSRF